MKSYIRVTGFAGVGGGYPANGDVQRTAFHSGFIADMQVRHLLSQRRDIGDFRVLKDFGGDHRYRNRRGHHRGRAALARGHQYFLDFGSAGIRAAGLLAQGERAADHRRRDRQEYDATLRHCLPSAYDKIIQ